MVYQIINIEGYVEAILMVEREEQSKFNYALAKLERLHMLHIAIHNARMANNYILIQSCLWGLRNELHERMEAEDEKKADDFEDELIDEINKYKSGLVYSYLPFLKYERFLFKLERDYGISLPDKDEDYDGL